MTSESVPLPSIRLPSAVEAEKAVLGSILLAPHRYLELSGFLVTDDFVFPAHREIWDAMAICSPLDIVTLMTVLEQRKVIEKMEGGVAYLLTLNSISTAENAEHYAKIVKDKSMLRRLVAIGLETASRASADCDPAELSEATRDSLAKLGAVVGSGPVRIGDALRGAEDVIEGRSREPEKYAVMTNLRDVDLLLGGLRGGQVIVIAANPGQGKSSLAYGIALDAAFAGVPSLVFSLEMKVQELIERAMIRTSRKPGLVHGAIDVDSWRDIKSASAKLRPIPLWIEDKKISYPRISSTAHAWRSRHAPKGRALMVVDYIGLIRSGRSAENRQAEVAEMSRGFKQLAGELDLPLLIVAQLNRANMSQGIREPVLSDIRDSGAIEQDADIVMFPWRDSFGAKIILAKHRNGDTGEIPLKWTGELMSFSDSEDLESQPWL